VGSTVAIGGKKKGIASNPLGSGKQQRSKGVGWGQKKRIFICSTEKTGQNPKG